ncbi:MAG: hypothetical protein NWF10_02380 [Candidatus Bathyarchaeota archaeon]|nr:hypothetical protein [Candidatus Bathyarchaeota archaeon]
MRYQYSVIRILFVFILLLGVITPYVVSQNFDQDYSFQFKYGIQDQELHVSIPASLYDYYQSIDRTIKKDSDYAAFVTQEAFLSMADQIWTYIGNRTRSDEQFANAVLTLIHQIRYEDNVNETKYPVETIVDDAGKCDTLSFLAASIMKAGGLDVVLLYFKGVHHMNIGVHLPYEPYGTWWWQQSVSYEFEDKMYWIAECTPAMDWKVGDIPPLLEGEIPLIIPLENNFESSPAQISSKIGQRLNSSSISINLSSYPLNVSSVSRSIRISGSITPVQSNETVVLYLSQDGIIYETIESKTDPYGNYSIRWNSSGKGTYYLMTSWWGNSEFAGADSEIVTLFLGFPNSIIQFESPSYYYMYGFPGASSFELDNRKGLKDFLDIQLNGSGVVLSGEIIVFSSEQLITIPKNGESPINLRELSITRGKQPLRLPQDIEKKTNDQFAIILRNNDNSNYTLNLKGLDEYDLSFGGEYNESSSILINASSLLQEDTWYSVEAKISENKISAIITDEFGYPVEIVDEIKTDGSAGIELLLLLTNDINKIVAFKGLKFETVSSIQQDDSDQHSFYFQIPIQYFILFVLIIVGLLLAIGIKKRNAKKDLL